MRREDVSPSLVRQLMDYHPETGVLVWKPRSPKMWEGSAKNRKSAALRWEKTFAGKPALITLEMKGYRVGLILGCAFKAHRVAFAHYHGHWPKGFIDHINGVRDDNRISNLRDVTAKESVRNTKLYRNNRTGVTGVNWHSSSRRWVAQISGESGQIWLGTFEKIDDAIAARKAAEIAHNYHPNHGRKA